MDMVSTERGLHTNGSQHLQAVTRGFVQQNRLFCQARLFQGDATVVERSEGCACHNTFLLLVSFSYSYEWSISSRPRLPLPSLRASFFSFSSSRRPSAAFSHASENHTDDVIIGGCDEPHLAESLSCLLCTVHICTVDFCRNSHSFV